MKYRVICGMFFSILVADTEEEAIRKGKEEAIRRIQEEEIWVFVIEEKAP